VLREARLKYVARHYIRPETLIAANARIVDHHADLELATRWGGGEVASIDGLRFVVPNRTIHAGFNRRYYHRRRGVTALTTTADHHAALHTVVVPGTQPDALYLLDGLLDPQTSVRPREVMTDTAGYTVMWTVGCVKGRGHQLSAGSIGSPSSLRRCARRAAVQRWRSTSRGQPRCSASAARRSSVSRRVRSLGA
jgi:hypothetical protein